MEYYRIYSGNPSFRMFRTQGRKSDLTFGFENEIFFNEDSEKKHLEFTKFMDKYPFLYAKYEGSNYGIEVNSHPMNWGFIEKNYDFMKELAQLRAYNFNVNRTCGFHIHIGRKYFTHKHLAKMLKFFYHPNHGDFIYKVSKRRGPDLAEFACPYLQNFSINLDNIDIYQDSFYFDMAKWGKVKFVRYIDEKGCALNLYPSKTIEIRIFCGTLNPDLYKAHMQFARMVVLFTKKTRIKNVTVRNFIGFVKKNMEKYNCKELYQLVKNPKVFKR